MSFKLDEEKSTRKERLKKKATRELKIRVVCIGNFQPSMLIN